ncbi:ABC transporter ATP-binding protein [Eubacterium oxidoreducens]|uniref:ABC-type nitrate/sulfonate/bicarbonate transport system, ATPase component n=1 Tax=Eubacterium oxidoreducens TaxID=1732 RepID=A0A1G6C4B3_EUBOX|nr:ABC transporter ATP-binding protein [Eubacterium oxidoreducens]SDB27690.1 ABC-type nitrate/sulfonate/bicarbonate transport system, ATPase component [Eubacterium oxidoreducens]
MSDTVLTAKQITHSYEKENIIEDVSVHLKKEEIVSLLGVSGVGKTTLFQILSGLVRPDSGQVYLHEQEITGQAGHVSYMLQKDLLMPYHTMEDNVAMPLIIQGMKKSEARKKASSYFAEFGIEGTQRQYPSQLSGGMRQRAALLRTYLFGKEVALLDEPFSALDAITKSEMHRWYLEVMHRIRLSTIFVTHDIEEALFLSDRIWIMAGHPGRIVKEIVLPKKKEDFLLTNDSIEIRREILSVL